MGRYEETLASFPEPLKAAGLPPDGTSGEARTGADAPVLFLV